jgi:hypothetical protein
LTGVPANTISGCDLILGFGARTNSVINVTKAFLEDRRVASGSWTNRWFVSEPKCPGAANALRLKGNVAASELEKMVSTTFQPSLMRRVHASGDRNI